MFVVTSVTPSEIENQDNQVSRGAAQRMQPTARAAGPLKVFSVSESNVIAVTRYIARQAEHHKKHSFQEEYVAFLKKNNISYDEKYIWE